MGCESLQYNAWVPTFLKKDATFIYTLKLQVKDFHPNIHCHENFIYLEIFFLLMKIHHLKILKLFSNVYTYTTMHWTDRMIADKYFTTYLSSKQIARYKMHDNGWCSIEPPTSRPERVAFLSTSRPQWWHKVVVLLLWSAPSL